MRATDGWRARQHSRALNFVFPGPCPSSTPIPSARRKKRASDRPLRSSIACRLGADCLLKIFALFAAAGTEFLKGGKLFLGLVDIAGLDIELAEIFAGCLVVWLELQSLGVVGQRRFEVAG